MLKTCISTLLLSLSLFTSCFSINPEKECDCTVVLILKKQKMEILKLKYSFETLYAFESDNMYEYCYVKGKVDAIEECGRCINR